jgi:hypothetical protein
MPVISGPVMLGQTAWLTSCSEASLVGFFIIPMTWSIAGQSSPQQFADGCSTGWYSMCEPKVVESLELFRRKHDLQSHVAQTVHQIGEPVYKRENTDAFNRRR